MKNPTLVGINPFIESMYAMASSNSKADSPNDAINTEKSFASLFGQFNLPVPSSSNASAKSTHTKKPSSKRRQNA